MIKIYQLKEEHFDKAFLGYDTVMKAYGEPEIEWYNKIYEFDTNEDLSLEDIFYIFNMNRPEDFKGHSLSVSDIVDVDGESYYCDRFGWKVI